MNAKIADSEIFQHETAGGIVVERVRHLTAYKGAIETYIDALNERRGAVFSSNYEYPGRYTRWDTAIVDPPVAITSRARTMRIEALNARGVILLRPILDTVKALAEVTVDKAEENRIELTIAEPSGTFTEEERSRMPSVFTVLRAIVGLFFSEEDANLGLYGAFGYDLAFQFDPVQYKLKRPDDQRDLVLFIPDEIFVADHYAARAWVDRYEFTCGGSSTHGLARATPAQAFKPSEAKLERGDHNPGEYAKLVERAKESFKRGDLFEVVPGQTFYERCHTAPSEIFRRLKTINPSPYSFFINLGDNEYLVGASPEMFVRVNGRRIETCPISGTIKRGEDAISDSEQILKLLNSKKDESELTMCSDVDRNDKSRVCEPGSVRVIGRRQIEMYSRLIHTVDHIEGRLRDGMDAFDGFLSHAWAVTVTGAPKLWAMRFLEENERSPRAWYGGAIGMMHFNGDMNTGLTLRTIRVKDGVAEIRAGATLLFDSNPEEEEAETELKASAMIAAVREAQKSNHIAEERVAAKVGEGFRSCSLITRIPSCIRSPIISARPAPRSRRCARPLPMTCSTGSSRTSWFCHPDRARRRISIAKRPSTRRASGVADLRCLSRIAGTGRSLWRHAAPVAHSDARQAVAHSRVEAGADILGPAKGSDGRALSFDLRRSGTFAGRFSGDSGNRRRCHHGFRA